MPEKSACLAEEAAEGQGGVAGMEARRPLYLTVAAGGSNCLKEAVWMRLPEGKALYETAVVPQKIHPYNREFHHHPSST
jgi:hypothetical protein